MEIRGHSLNVAVIRNAQPELPFTVSIEKRSGVVANGSICDSMVKLSGSFEDCAFRFHEGVDPIPLLNTIFAFLIVKIQIPK